MKPRLYIFGWPSDLGGADTRLVHTLPIWTERLDVTIVPNDRFRLGEERWRAHLDALGVAQVAFDDLPERLDGYAYAFANQRFFTERRAHRVKERGLTVVWSSEMMWHHPGELDAVRDGVVDCVLYSSPLNREALQPAYANLRPGMREHVIANWVDPTCFPFYERPVRDDFTIGRLSRPDPVKFPDDFPLWYEQLGLAHPRYRVMAWSGHLRFRFRWHPFGAAWSLIPANDEPACYFLHSLDAFVYPLGTRFVEAWGRSTVEAMLTGLPVVIEPGHHLSTFVRHGETGFVCDGVAAFGEACRALERSPALRREIGAAARASAHDELCDRAAHQRAWAEVFPA